MNGPLSNKICLQKSKRADGEQTEGQKEEVPIIPFPGKRLFDLIKTAEEEEVNHG